MPLRRDVQEFHNICEHMIQLMQANPDLLTTRERLAIETDITHLMSALIAAQVPAAPEP